jgi:nucleoside-diphosphate-sugar epimerase
VICPIVIGTGQGSIKRKSHVLPWYADTVRKRQRDFAVGEGSNVYSVIHVRDLSAALILLLEKALEGDGKADWGDKGLYYVKREEFQVHEVANAIAKEMKKEGIISGNEVDMLTLEEARELDPYVGLLWASNMRLNGERFGAYDGVQRKEMCFQLFRIRLKSSQESERNRCIIL